MKNKRVTVWAVFVGKSLYAYGSREEMQSVCVLMKNTKGCFLGCKRVYIRECEALADAMRRPCNYEP